MAWYPGAIKLELQPESDSQAAIRPTQFIMHSIAAPWDEQRIYEYWRDSTNLESHFGLDYDGSLGQFIGTETKADANYRANLRPDGTGAVSIETASNLKHTDPWTVEQVEALIRLGVWLHQKHGIPLRICRTASDPGYGYHRLHADWSTGGTDCPGDARVKQFREVVFPGIVARATGKTPVPTNPAPTPAQESDVPAVLNESNKIDVEVGGEWLPLAFKDEGALLAGPVAALDVTVHLYFDTATSPDAKIQGVFYLTNADGSGASNALVVDKRGGGGHQFTHSQPIPAGKKLWFQVRAISPDGKPVTLLHRVASGPYWTA
ncbi:N-acetylmuramoyl-L-alanine amidase [Streptomyces sp. NPDC000618]|uniref:peptidoglycan recognition protein family protein n=1 Tax=Streptomyces sp. NPDC000618 TaxID=3154265 RepID=UPI003330F5FA